MPDSSRPDPRVARVTSTLRRAAAGSTAVVLAFVVGCGSDDGSTGADPASSLPLNAPVYLELNVRPEGDLRADVEAVAKKVLRTTDPGAEIVRVIDAVIEDDDGERTTFKEDIDPWLGDKIGVAITSLRSLEKPDFVVALASKDNDKAMDALADKDATAAEYKDVKYLRMEDGDSAAGTVGDTLLIGTENGFKAAVDATKADKQLDDSEGLANARDSVDMDGALGFAYVDLAKTITAVTASQPLIASQLGPLKDILGDASGIGLTVGVADDAIRLEAAQVGGPAGRPSGDPSATLAALPSTTIIGAGLGEVGETLRKVLDQLADIGPVAGQDPQRLLRGLETQLGLSLERDLISWMGEGALFAEGSSLTDLGGGLVVFSTKPATTKATLEKLVPLLRGFGAPIVDRAPDGADAGFRLALGGRFDVLVGLKGDRFVVGVNPALVRRVLDGPGTDPLGGDALFKSVGDKLGDGIRPSFFLNVAAVVGLVEQAIGDKDDFAKVKPYLDAFSAIVAGGRRDDGVNRSTVVVGVK